MEEAVKVAWAEMLALLMHLHNTTSEHANLLVGHHRRGTGYAAGKIFHRGFERPPTSPAQIAIPKNLAGQGSRTSLKLSYAPWRARV